MSAQETPPSATVQWNVKVKIEKLDRGSVVVKNRWVVGDSVTVQIEGHATINMLKQRIQLLVAAHSKHQTLRNTAGKVLEEIQKLEDCEGVTDGGMVMLTVEQPKEEEAPPVVLSDDEDLLKADEGDSEPLPDEAAMKKELSEDEQDKQNGLKGQAAELMEDGDKAAALAKFTEAVMVGAPSALMMSKRAEILLKLKRPKAAAKDAAVAIEINPDSAKAYKLRGKALRYMGDYTGALKDLNKAQSDDYDDDLADMHAYVKKRVAKITLKAQQDAKKAEAEAAEAKAAAEAEAPDPA